MPCSHAAAAFPWHIIQPCSAGNAVTSCWSIEVQEKRQLFLPCSPCVSPRRPQAGIHHLPGLQIDSLPSWLLLGLWNLLPLLLDQRSGCPGQILGGFWAELHQVLANLSRSRSSSCCYTPTCKHLGRQITTIHNKTKLLGFSFVALMKVIRLRAKRQRLEGAESRA